MTDTPESRYRNAGDDLNRDPHVTEDDPFAGLARQARRIDPSDVALIVFVAFCLALGAAGGFGFWLIKALVQSVNGGAP